MEQFWGLFLFFITGLMLQTGCYYDKEEELYPPQNCDTSNVTYSSTIAPILSNRCLGCHSNANAQNFGNGISFEGYANIAGYLTTSTEIFLGSINHTDGYPAMPPSSPKLTPCNISQIENWIADGYPDN